MQAERCTWSARVNTKARYQDRRLPPARRLPLFLLDDRDERAFESCTVHGVDGGSPHRILGVLDVPNCASGAVVDAARDDGTKLGESFRHRCLGCRDAHIPDSNSFQRHFFIPLGWVVVASQSRCPRAV